MMIGIEITLTQAGGLAGAGRRAIWNLLFDRAEVIDDDGFHGGYGVPEYVNEASGLFDASTAINLAGFHGGTGVTEP